MFYAAVIMAIISVVWSIWSLKGLSQNPKVTKGVKKELSKGRVVYQDPSSDDSSDSFNES